MSSNNQMAPPPKFKMWVLYLDGNSRTYYSYPQAEQKGTAMTRLQTLVLERWAGMVGIAKIYDNHTGELLQQYQSRSNLNAFKPVQQLPQPTTTR